MLSDNASVILDAVRHYQRIGKWFVTLFLIMPDHIHMLVHVAMARAAEDVGPYLLVQYPCERQSISDSKTT